MNPKLDDPQDQTPRLDRHQGQAVRVHERHEHAAEEVVERGEEQQQQQAGHRPHRSEGAADVDGLGLVIADAGLVPLDPDAQQVRRGQHRQHHGDAE